jgi:hypothetical protein
MSDSKAHVMLFSEGDEVMTPRGPATIVMVNRVRNRYTVNIGGMGFLVPAEQVKPLKVQP